MMKAKNIHGLSRYIPVAIRRRLRQEAGFGCVVCGLAIAAYEHIDPEFKDARCHDPAKMAYVCEGCHGRVTRNFWSKQKLITAKNSPHCRQTGKCHDAFDVGDKGLKISMGRNLVEGIESIFVVDEVKLLGVRPPEKPGGPYRLSGRFYDDEDNLLFEINDNEWCGEANKWDIECVGGRIVIRTAPDRIALQIHCDPGAGISIERVNMAFRGVKIKVDSRCLEVAGKDGGEVIMSGRFFRGQSTGGIAFHFVTQGNHPASHGGAINIGDKGSLRIGGGAGGFVLGTLPKPAFPDTPTGRLLSKSWGEVKLRPARKLGENDPCWCDSGRKYKRCHGTRA